VYFRHLNLFTNFFNFFLNFNKTQCLKLFPVPLEIRHNEISLYKNVIKNLTQKLDKNNFFQLQHANEILIHLVIMKYSVNLTVLNLK